MKKFFNFIFLVFILLSVSGCNKNEDHFSFIQGVQQISGNEYRYFVNNQTEIISINDLITNSKNNGYFITTRDSTKKIEGQVSLNEGDNYYQIHLDENTILLDIYRFHLYTVSFNTNWELTIDPIQVEENQTITPQVIDRPGYSCSWDYDFSKPINNSLTANAIYTPSEYTIHLNGNGGTVTPISVGVTYSHNFTLPIPTYSGYEFTGWEDSDGVAIQSGQYLYTSDITLYATWEIIHYSITYDFQGIDYKDSLNTSYTIIDSVVLPSLVKKGYDFLGWEDQNGTIYTSTIPTGTNGNLNLTAMFSAKTYKVTFRLMGGYYIDGDLSQNENFVRYVKCDDLVQEPTMPFHKEQFFDGWYYNDEKWDFESDSMPSEDITLDARYYIPNETSEASFTYEQKSNFYVQGFGKTSGILIKSYTGSEKNVRIPKTINGQSVFGIGEMGLMGTDIEQLYCDDNILYFDNKSISFMNNLKNIVFAANSGDFNLDSIYKCNSIEFLNFPNKTYFRNGYEEGTTSSSKTGRISCCDSIKTIWIKHYYDEQQDNLTFWKLASLKNMYLESFDEGGTPGFIQSCGSFNFYTNTTAVNHLLSRRGLLWNPHYLYIDGVCAQNLDIPSDGYFNFLGGCSYCLNDFKFFIFHNANECKLNYAYFPKAVKGVKYVDYTSETFTFNGHFSGDYTPEFIFIPTNVRMVNIKIDYYSFVWSNKPKIVIPSNVTIVDQCLNTGIVFIDKAYDHNTATSFGDTEVYWQGQWTFDTEGFPKVI